MLSQTDLERERYESRRKAQLDDQTRLKVARLEGREEGRMEEKIAIIQVFERLLDRPETATAELAKLPMEKLSQLAAELQEQVPPAVSASRSAW